MTTKNPVNSLNNQKTAANASTEQPSYFSQAINSDYVSYIRKVGLAVIIFFLLFIAAKWAAGLASKKFYEHTNLKDTKKEESVGKLVHDIVFYILLIITVFVSFEIVGFDVGVILGGISFGVGFAFKEVLGNMIAGVMILNVKELKLGDIVEIDGRPPYFGKIEEITIRYTTIRTLDLRQVVIPNMELITNPIKTYSSEEVIKFNTLIPVSYDEDLERAMQVMRDSANALEIVRKKDSTRTFIMQYGEAGVEIKVFFRVDPNCGLPMDYIIGDVNGAIIDGLRKAGIKMPYKHIVATMDRNDTDIMSNVTAIKEKLSAREKLILASQQSK